MNSWRVPGLSEPVTYSQHSGCVKLAISTILHSDLNGLEILIKTS